MPKTTINLLGVLVLFSAVLSAAEPHASPVAGPVTGQAQPAFASFDELMTEFMAEHGVTGAAVAVARRGKLVYARGFGWSDTDARHPVQPDSLFRIASISKPITAVAILQAVERGELDLEARVYEFLGLDDLAGDAEVDPRWRQVTVRQLLQHRGGWDRGESFDPMFRAVQFAEELGVDPPATPEHVIRCMLRRPLDFDPGTRYAYSNFGYCLLGRVLEKVSGVTYEEHVQRAVLALLGITRMRIGQTRQRSPGEVAYVDRQGRTGPCVFRDGLGKPVATPYGAWHLEAMDSHGGWIASAVDLVRFASSFDRQEPSPVLGQAMVETMFACPEGARDEEGNAAASFYGLGWLVRPKGESRNTWHMGSLAGTSTLLVRRHDGLTWAVLFNNRNSKQGKTLAGRIDSLVHRAANRVEAWPEHDLFLSFGLAIPSPRAPVPAGVLTAETELRVFATLWQAPGHGGWRLAPEVEVGRLGAGEVLLPDCWSWRVQPANPEGADPLRLAADLEGLARTAHSPQALPSLSLAGCAHWTSEDVLRVANSVRGLCLRDGPALSADALARVPSWIDAPDASLQGEDTLFVDEGVASPNARVERLVRQAMAEQSLVGMSVAILDGGQLVHARGFGFADREQGAPATAASTLYRWASISKPVTSLAALRARELDRDLRWPDVLDRDVCELVPEFPAKDAPITLRQLLAHQGGIVHYSNGRVVRADVEYAEPNPYESVVLALDTFKLSPLVAEPGTRYSYSTHGYILASAVVERAAGERFSTFVDDWVGVPCGLDTFQPDYQWLDIPGRATGYHRTGFPSLDTDVSWKLGGGGYLSSVLDLARFAQGLLRGDLLEPASQAMAWTAQRTRDGKRTRYGLGFNVGIRNGRRFVAHSGAQEKTSTYLLILPDEQRAVALMTNTMGAKLGGLAWSLVP